MPPHKPLLCLKDQSVKALVDHLCTLWDSVELSRKNGEFDAAEVSTKLLAQQFVVFPGILLAELLEPAVAALMHRGRVATTPTMLQCLLQPSSIRVNLSGLFYRYRLPGEVNRRISTVLTSTIPTMANLRSLNLTAKANNEILHLLCRHCRHLEELVVRLSDIGDEGLQFFGVTKEPDVHGCPELSELSLAQCFLVQPKTIARLLSDLKHLKRLDYDDCVKALSYLLPEGAKSGKPRKKKPKMEETGPEEQEEQRYSLTHLDQKVKVFEPSPCFMEFMVRSCPEVESLSLLLRNEDSLAELPRFALLNTLSVELERGAAGMVFRAFVQAMGPRLVNLHLTCDELPWESIMAIGAHCTNLKQLKIIRKHGHNEGRFVFPKNAAAFRELELLSITSTDESIMEEEWLYMTSAATSLKELSAYGEAEFMTDEFWANFLNKVNGLPQLEIVAISCGMTPFSLGPDTVEGFIHSCPNLRKIIGVHGWEKLVDEDFENYKDLAKKNNLLLELS